MLGQLFDRGVRADAGDRLAGAVDRVGGALELGADDVPEDDAADCLAPGRRSDHGNARWGEERAQRRYDGEVVALLDVSAVCVRRLDREGDLEGAPVERARDAEPCILEHAHHGRVLAHHLCDEALDPHGGRALGQLLEHPRADAAPLLIVGDGERHLRRRRVAQPRVARERDDVLTVAACECPDEGALRDPVGLEERLDERLPHGGRTVEPEVEAPLRERAEEPEERTGVLAPGRPQPQRAAVAQDDVDESVLSDSGLPGACGVRSLVRQRFHSPGSRHPASQYAEGPRGRALWSRCAKRFN